MREATVFDFVSSAEEVASRLEALRVEAMALDSVGERVCVELYGCEEADKALEAMVGMYCWSDDAALRRWRKNEYGGLCNEFNSIDSDEEYLAVLALLRVSKEKPELVARITDSDGDFLLIEAAETLPEWLEPERSAYRCWICAGKIIVLMNEPHDRGLDIGEALVHAASVKENSSSSAATTAAYRRIRFDQLYTSSSYEADEEIESFFPRALAALELGIRLNLSEKAAHIYRAKPRLLAAAARALSSHHTSDINIGPLAQSHVVRLSRSIYTKFQSILIPPPQGQLGRKVELGYKVSLGLELLARQDTSLLSEMHATDSAFQPPSLPESHFEAIDPKRLEAHLEALFNTNFQSGNDMGGIAKQVDDFIDTTADDCSDTSDQASPPVTFDADTVLRLLQGVEPHLSEQSDSDDDIQEIHAAHDAELSQDSTMAHSFRRAQENNDGPLTALDLDFNLVTSLLDSVQSQSETGNPGPASVLLSQALKADSSSPSSTRTFDESREDARSTTTELPAARTTAVVR